MCLGAAHMCICPSCGSKNVTKIKLPDFKLILFNSKSPHYIFNQNNNWIRLYKTRQIIWNKIYFIWKTNKIFLYETPDVHVRFHRGTNSWFSSSNVCSPVTTTFKGWSLPISMALPSPPRWDAMNIQVAQCNDSLLTCSCLRLDPLLLGAETGSSDLPLLQTYSCILIYPAWLAEHRRKKIEVL